MLTAALRGLGRAWSEQQLLDPGQVDRTLIDIRAAYEQIEPELVVLRDRQDDIAHELRNQLDQARPSP